MQEKAILRCCQFRQAAPSMHDRTFVGSDSVHTCLQRSANMIGCRLPGDCIQRAHFKHYVSPAQPQPLANIVCLLPLREVGAQQPLGGEALRRNQPAQSPRSNAGYAPNNPIEIAQFLLFFLEEFDEGLADVAESDDTKVVGANAGFSRLKWL